MDAETSHCAHCEMTLSLKMWRRYYKFLDIMHVFLSFYILPALPNVWFTMEINPDLRINVVLHSCAHSNHWLWQAADGVLYSDLLLHSRGCSTFCEPFCSWIIDRILSVGCVGFHILSIEWKDLASVMSFFKAFWFLIVRALAGIC